MIHVTHSHIQPTMNDQWLTIVFIVIDVVISSEQFMLRQSVPTHLPNHQLVRCLPQQSCKGLPQPLTLGLRQGLWCVPPPWDRRSRKLGGSTYKWILPIFWTPLGYLVSNVQFRNFAFFLGKSLNAQKRLKNLPTSWKIQTSSCSQRNIKEETSPTLPHFVWYVSFWDRHQKPPLPTSTCSFLHEYIQVKSPEITTPWYTYRSDV